ncbi:19686_t:CDS:2, partial [Racocetra fulgida]
MKLAEINDRKIVPKSVDTVQNQLEAIRQELEQVHLNERGSELMEELIDKATKMSKEYVEVESESFTKKGLGLSINSDKQPCKKSNIDSDGKKLLKNEESDSERQVEVAELASCFCFLDFRSDDGLDFSCDGGSDDDGSDFSCDDDSVF